MKYEIVMLEEKRAAGFWPRTGKYKEGKNRRLCDRRGKPHSDPVHVQHEDGGCGGHCATDS